MMTPGLPITEGPQEDHPLEAGALSERRALEHLSRWVERGHLRRLDFAFASFVMGLDPAAGPGLTVAAALLSRMESQGHTFLPIAALADLELAHFGWPPDQCEAARQLWQSLPQDVEAWIQELGSCRPVWWIEPVGAREGGQDPDAPKSTDRSGRPDQGQPLVLEGSRIYLRRFWRDRRIIDVAVRARCQVSETVDAGRVRPWIDRLFDAGGAAREGDPFTGPDWQRIACALALRGRFTIITGGPGTGKTYTAARLLALLLAMSPAPERLRVALAAPTGKAAARLRQSIDRSLAEVQSRLGAAIDLEQLTRRIGGAQTLHTLLGSRPDSRRFRHHAGQPLDVDVVIVDEASMIHLEMMAALLQALPPHARLVLLGDKDQLASVEPGAVLGELCAAAATRGYSPDTAEWIRQATGQTIPAAETEGGAGLAMNGSEPLSQQTVMLRRSRRFDGPIGQLALAVNAGAPARRIGELIAGDSSGAIWQALGPVKASLISEIAVQGRPGAAASYRDYCRLLAQPPAAGDRASHANWAKGVIEAFDRFRVLCAIREGDWGVEGLNRSIERALEEAGLLTIAGAVWYPGRPVMITRNDRALGVFNGDIGITLPAHDGSGRLKVHFLDGNALRAVSVTRLGQVETAYAMTVHKSQGSEFGHTLLALPGHGGRSLLTRELVYTGITRASTALSLVAERDGIFEAAVMTSMTRA